MLKSAKKVFDIGRLVLVLGSVVYLFELITQEKYNLTTPILILYAIAVVLIVIGWFGTKDERREEKARLKAEKEA